MEPVNISYLKIKRRYQYCDTCGTLMPTLGIYCVRCGLPDPPESDPENGLSFSQAISRITLITLLFIIVAVFKLEINPFEGSQYYSTEEVQLEIAEDEDFKLIFKVNVSFANLRDQPNLKTSNILFVLPKDTRVEVLKIKGRWSRIRSYPKKGEPNRIGWLASKLIDSEIK